MYERGLRPAMPLGAVSGSHKSHYTPEGSEARAGARIPTPTGGRAPRIHVISRQQQPAPGAGLAGRLEAATFSFV